MLSLAQPEPHLRVVSPQEALTDEVETLHDQLKGAERDVRAWRMRCAKLERDRAGEREHHEEREIIQRLFDYWREKSGRKRAKLTGERFDLVALKLGEGFTARELAEAIVGCCFDPWITANRNGSSERHDDLLTALKDGAAVERYRKKRP
jgi:hypothetical protein